MISMLAKGHLRAALHGRSIILILALTLSASMSYAKKAKDPLQVVVTSTFMSMHTGPGKGFPLFHVVEKGETITLIKFKTDWIKVKTRKGHSGWIHRRHMDNTVGVHGETVNLGIPKRGDISQDPWEFGATTGEFDDIASLGIHAGYKFTENISAELRFNQATGRFSNSRLYSWGLMHQPFPEWRVSPFFTLANGKVKVTPNSGLSQFQAREDSYFMLGLGAYYYFSHRIIIRFEFNSYNSLNTINNNDDGNDEIDEWKIGISTFF